MSVWEWNSLKTNHPAVMFGHLLPMPGFCWSDLIGKGVLKFQIEWHCFKLRKISKLVKVVRVKVSQIQSGPAIFWSLASIAMMTYKSVAMMFSCSSCIKGNSRVFKFFPLNFDAIVRYNVCHCGHYLVVPIHHIKNIQSLHQSEADYALGTISFFHNIYFSPCQTEHLIDLCFSLQVWVPQATIHQCWPSASTLYGSPLHIMVKFLPNFYHPRHFNWIFIKWWLLGDALPWINFGRWRLPMDHYHMATLICYLNRHNILSAAQQGKWEIVASSCDLSLVVTATLHHAFTGVVSSLLLCTMENGRWLQASDSSFIVIADLCCAH